MSKTPWWAKVRAHIGAGKTSYADLASATGISERTLRRWIRRRVDPDARHSPAGELDFVRRVAAALGWPVWYLICDDCGYPPPSAFLRLAARLEELRPERRQLVAQLLADDVAAALVRFMEACDGARDSIRRGLSADRLVHRDRD